MTDQPNDATSSSHDPMADEPTPGSGAGSGDTGDAGPNGAAGDAGTADGGAKAREWISQLEVYDPGHRHPGRARGQAGGGEGGRAGGDRRDQGRPVRAEGRRRHHRVRAEVRTIARRGPPSCVRRRRGRDERLDAAGDAATPPATRRATCRAAMRPTTPPMPSTTPPTRRAGTPTGASPGGAPAECRRPSVYSAAMTVRPIVMLGDPRLRLKGETVDSFGKSLHGLLDDLAATMRDAPGVGPRGAAARRTAAGLRGGGREPPVRAGEPADRADRWRGSRPRGLPVDPGLRRLRDPARAGVGRRPEPDRQEVQGLRVRPAGPGAAARAGPPRRQAVHRLPRLDGRAHRRRPGRRQDEDAEVRSATSALA